MPLHIFMDRLRHCRKTQHWPHDQVAHLFSDDLAQLKGFALSVGLRLDWLQWSDNGTPHFDLTPEMRTRAFLKGALEITDADAATISGWWQARHMAVLKHLKRPRPFRVIA
jgi:hypothetical protein